MTRLPYVLAAALALASSPSALAAPVTECTAVGACYCVNADFRAAVDEKVAYYRATIAAERAKGKAIGYLSVPLSTAGGGYFGVNREVAQAVRERLESRYGAGSVFVLNPTAREADLPTVGGVRAGQGDYLVMWSRILEGEKGAGEDFDFAYFVGPSDYAAYFGLTGKGDMDRLAAWFDERLAKDADLRRAVERGSLTAAQFRNYYALKAGAAFSAGSHDEWNVLRAVNEKRRSDPRLGIANQIALMYDGRGLSAAEAEQGVAPGNAGTCKPGP